MKHLVLRKLDKSLLSALVYLNVERTEYMSRLEIASVTDEVVSFAKFIAELILLGMEGRSAATRDHQGAKN